MELLIYTILRGLAIGIIISAPMGPIGMLCIQRTLNAGRKAGLYTGIGAAISDLFYCLLTGFGLSFIEDFLTNNQNIIQIAGSLVLVAFGVYLLRKNPERSMQSLYPVRVSAGKNIITGFAFTFSNPLILFLIIGLFARFNFMEHDMQWPHYVLGYICILAGALGWWWLVTYSVNKVRTRFNVRTMKFINKLIGFIILIFAFVGIMSGLTASAHTTEWNSRAGFGSWPVDPTSGRPVAENSRLMSGLSPDSSDFSLRLMLKTDAHEFSIVLADTDGNQHLITLENISEGIPELAERRKVRIFTTNAAGNVYNTADYNGSVSDFSVLTLERDKGELTLSGSKHKHSFGLFTTNLADIGIAAPKGNKLTIHSGRWTHRPPISKTLASPYDTAEIERIIESSPDVNAGKYAVFSSTLDSSRLGMGGDYIFALLPDNNSGYLILYLDGARTNSGEWKCGMVKAQLSPTPHYGVYDVKWHDAEGNTLSHGVKATFTDDVSVRIIFPHQSSDLTLRKISR